MKDAVLSVINKLAAEVDRKRAAEQSLLDAAHFDKSSMPDNYWQERHRAECKLRVALAILEVLNEEE